MADQSSVSPEIVRIGFGDEIEFASLDSLGVGKNPVALAARFVVTELITVGDGPSFSAAKIMSDHSSERLSMSGTMDPPVRRVGSEPWDIGRIASAIAWQFPSGMPDTVRSSLEENAVAGPIECLTF